MTEQIRTRGPWSIVVLLIMTVIWFAGANWLAAKVLDERGSNLGYWLVGQKWSLLEDLEGPVDTVILGDSSGNQGINPEVVDERLGGRSINLCTIGHAIALDDVWMLREYLDRFGAPSRVLVIHGYDIWHRSFDRSLLGRIPRLGMLLEQGELPFGWGDIVPYLIDRYVRLYGEHSTIGRLLRRPWSPPRAKARPLIQGFMVDPIARPHTVRRNAERHLRLVREEVFAMSEENQRGLVTLSSLAEAYGFRLYVAHGPTVDTLASDPAFIEYNEQVREELVAFAAEHEHVTVIDRVFPFSENQMTSADHIILSASFEFTDAVLDEIVAVEGAE